MSTGPGRRRAALAGLCLAVGLTSSGDARLARRDSYEVKTEIATAQALRLFYAGDFARAKQYFHEASIAYRRTPTRANLNTLKMEGICLLSQDDIDGAIDVLRRALRLTDEMSGRGEVNGWDRVDAPNVLGWAYYVRGDIDRAIEYMKEAEDRCRSFKGWDNLRARVLIESGVVRSETADYSSAYKYLSNGLALRNCPEGVSPMDVTRGFNALAELERRTGNESRALEYLKQAIETGRRAYGVHPYNRSYLVEALVDLATLHSTRTEYAEARTALKEALATSRELKTRRLIARVLLSFGNLERDQGKMPSAVDFHEQALALSTTAGIMPLVAVALSEIGRDHLCLEQPEQAISHFQRALDVGGATLSPDVRASIDAGLAEAYELLGEDANAARFYRLAVASIEKVRIEVLTRDRKIGFWQTTQTLFAKTVSLLFRLSQKDAGQAAAAEAFAYAERAKARALLDTLAEAKINIGRGLDDKSRGAESEILREIARIRKAQLGENVTNEQSAGLTRDLVRAEERLEDLEQQARLSNPEFAALKYPNPLPVEVVQQKVLDSETVLVEYQLGQKQSFVWAISRRSFRMLELPGRDEIERRVQDYRKLISAAPRDENAFNRCASEAADLYGLLLGPIVKDLRPFKQILIVPDGLLHYLPFESLVEAPARAGEFQPRLLLESHRVVYSPSASVLPLLRARHSMDRSMDLLVYADPTMRPAESSPIPEEAPVQVAGITRNFCVERGLRLGPLPYAREEASGIAALFPQNASQVRVGDDASESSLKQEDLRSFRFLHFATHGLIDPEIPARSGIVFSLVDKDDEDGILTMDEIFNLDLDADLVVLSACQSGLGKLVRGEGIVGLTRAFEYAGASSVVVSLWNVPDWSTAELMTNFYKHLRQGLSKSESLRRAKLDMIHSKTPAYRFPYYWAPFVLTGSPR